MDIVSIDFAAWAVVIGALLPVVISFVKNAAWDTQIKKYVAAAISLVVAVVYTGAELGWEIESWSEALSLLAVSAGAIFTLAQSTYKGFWEGTKTEKFARNTLVVSRAKVDDSDELEV